MPDKLFVYGTLKPGESMNQMLSSIGGSWKKGTVQGEFIRPNEIAGFPYPGVILNDESGDIDGYVFESKNLHSHWDRLDAYEGSSYRRVITEVTRDDGQTVEAYIYELKSELLET